MNKFNSLQENGRKKIESQLKIAENRAVGAALNEVQRIKTVGRF